jgi:hypothetical protein
MQGRLPGSWLPPEHLLELNCIVPNAVNATPAFASADPRNVLKTSEMWRWTVTGEIERRPAVSAVLEPVASARPPRLSLR